MKGATFPIIGTKVKGLEKRFDLSSPDGRREYFDAKVGAEIGKLQEFLGKRTFMANMLGKKGAGKGTYSKMFMEAVGVGQMSHIAVGDLVRDIHAAWPHFSKSPELADLKKHYRGFISFDEAVERLLARSTEKLLPTEFILALLKYNIDKHHGETLFIDGLPRETDQVSYSLYFRDLINYRDDPDFFVLIDIPEVVIDARIKTRVVCPSCKSPRNLKLLLTKYIGFDESTGEFYLMCDNPGCNKARMMRKEGDNLGIDPIRPRLAKDEEIMKTVMSLHGVPKIFLRNSIPVETAKEQFDEYELTPAYGFERDAKTGKIKVLENPWVFADDNGVESYSLLPAPVVVSMIKQMVDVLEL